MDFLSQIPNDVLIEIFNYLKMKEWFYMRLINKKCNSCCKFENIKRKWIYKILPRSYNLPNNFIELNNIIMNFCLRE